MNLKEVLKPTLLINLYRSVVKKEKMPDYMIRTEYALEYGCDAMEYVNDTDEYGFKR